MSEEFFKNILPILPSLVIGIAKILAQKLGEVGGVTPAEQSIIDFLNFLEGFWDAQTKT
jgi:hypothetical protein